MTFPEAEWLIILVWLVIAAAAWHYRGRCPQCGSARVLELCPFGSVKACGHCGHEWELT